MPDVLPVCCITAAVVASSRCTDAGAAPSSGSSSPLRSTTSISIFICGSAYWALVCRSSTGMHVDIFKSQLAAHFDVKRQSTYLLKMSTFSDTT